MIKLRDYQIEDCEISYDTLRQHGSGIGVAATGLGKTVTFAHLAKRYVDAGKRVLVITDRRKLTSQAQNTFEKFIDITPGIEQAGSTDYHDNSDIVVGTVQTLLSNPIGPFSGPGEKRYQHWRPDHFGLIIVDECEGFITKNRMALVRYFREGGAHVFGTTATPIRSDEKSMSLLFEKELFRRDIRWAVENGYLVPPKAVNVRVDLDFDALPLTGTGEARDYSQQALQELIYQEEPMMQLAQAIQDLSQKRATIGVCAGVDEAKAVGDYLKQMTGKRVETIYGELKEDERNRMYDGFEAGDFQYFMSCDMLTTGFDAPLASFLAMCRPTKSKRLFIQCVGRVLRLIDPSIGYLPDADARREAIAKSAKPDALVGVMCGLGKGVGDMTVAEALAGDTTEPEVANRAGQNEKESTDAVDALETLESAEEEARQERDRLEAKVREQITVQGTTRVQESSGDGSVLIERGGMIEGKMRRDKVIKTLKDASVDEKIWRKWTPEKCEDVAKWYKKQKESGKVHSYKGIQRLRQWGIERPQDLPHAAWVRANRRWVMNGYKVDNDVLRHLDAAK